jgi:two-component system, cell cycle response regulator
MSNIPNSQRRLLLVEDDQAVLDVVLEALKSEGFQVKATTSSREAMQLVQDYSPHLVLTDNDMPEVTGLDMLRDLRGRKNYVTVIFLSGRTDAQFVAEALLAGADDFIRKPFRINELLARIQVALRTNDLHRDLLEANAKLSEQIERDDLTGLYNMKSMYPRIDMEIKRSQRGERYMACVMLDMDKFKSVNDEHDHLFGSFVLTEMAELIRKNMRETDFAARYGGDEFLVVLTETDKQGPALFCERLRKSVEANVFTDGKDSIQLTVSLGYALGGFDDVRDARALLRAADHNLYEAKKSGRNRFYGP